VVLGSFVFTSCTAACPLLTHRMALVQQRLRGVTPAAVLVSITVDPARDTAEKLATYAARFGADRRHWHFLRDEPVPLAPVLAQWDEWTRPLPSGDLDQPARLHSSTRAAASGRSTRWSSSTSARPSSTSARCSGRPRLSSGWRWAARSPERA
jgi:cytochrome oxidase Cu insertion factor (SCO1/SenC/PrrC family)